MALGLSVLRWTPSEFWHATPRELMAAWAGLNGGRRMTPAGGSDLKRLMEVFPDA
ncbi:phage tail assembly chaperone [Microvirga sp. c23x22]|uniref:Phage tail assembly chaperone n=2 Tax=Microvirga terricola TaxID=2719797 RepID=A0ABX0VAM2_9HYPH|nr:phage tail assembly chaperone [Microvirga terricola]